MHREADRSQAAGNAQRRRSKVQLALIGGALVVFAIAGVLLGTAALSPEEDEAMSPAAGGSGLVGESLAASGKAAAGQAESLATISTELAALRRELEEERRARQALAKRLASLSARVETTESERPAAGTTPAGRQTGDTATKLAASAALAAATSSQTHPALADPQRDQPWFNRDALAAAGISSSEIKEIEERWEQHEMDMLYLDDQSKRDGSFRTPGYNQERAGLNRELREDLGPEGYDAYLYATGQPNRVLVRQVLENSPAGRAGLQAGDQVIRYSGTRVFLPRELKQAVTAGELGVSVPIEVLRDGTSYHISVPGGPLGVSLKPIAAQPLHD